MGTVNPATDEFAIWDAANATTKRISVTDALIAANPYVTIYSGATQNPQVFGWAIVDGRATQVVLDASVTTGTTAITLTQGASFDGNWDLTPIGSTLATFTAQNCTFGTFAPGALANLSYFDCIGNGFTLVLGSSFDVLDLSGCTNALTVKLGEGVTTSLTLPASLFDLTINTVTGLGVNYPAIDISGSAVTTLGLTLVIAPSFDATGCTALTAAGVVQSQIPSISFSGCSALTLLNLGLTQCTALSLSGCNSLQTLLLGATTFPTLDLSASTSIETLDLASSVFTSVDVSGCPSLLTINSSEANFTSIDASGSSLVTYTGALGFGVVTPQSVDLSGCVSLTSVIAQGTGVGASLATFNCSGCTALISANFLFAGLVSVNLSGCTSLTDVQIESATGNFLLNLTNCTSLVSVILANNNYSGSTQIASLNLTGCSSLAGIGVYFSGGDISTLTTITVTTLPALISADFCGSAGASLNVASVNALLIALDANGLNNGAVNVSGGTSAAPTGAGITAKNNLIGKGWTVTTN
jgi:hypothetical protein